MVGNLPCSSWKLPSLSWPDSLSRLSKTSSMFWPKCRSQSSLHSGTGLDLFLVALVVGPRDALRLQPLRGIFAGLGVLVYGLEVENVDIEGFS